MIITIDGPTASGKSSVAQRVAQKLGIYHLNTGLLYRAIGYLLSMHYDMTDQELSKADASLVMQLMRPDFFSYTYDSRYGAGIFVSGQDITSYLKTPHVDRCASLVSSSPAVREALLAFQRSFAQDHDLVCDGRDCGTVVFPSADYKFFLTASIDARAVRWQKAQRSRGKDFTFQESCRALEERDLRDTTRDIAPLKKANGAIVLDNSLLTQEQTVQQLLSFIQHPAPGTI